MDYIMLCGNSVFVGSLWVFSFLGPAPPLWIFKWSTSPFQFFFKMISFKLSTSKY